MISKERARNNFHILKLTRLPFYAIFSLTTWSIYHKCYSYFVRVPNLKKFILIFLTLFIKNVYSYQDQNTITEGTKNFIKKEIQTQHKTVDLKTITVRILDNKTINNKTCINEINYSFPIHSNINKRATVVAECKDENSWKVYIPVNIKFFANAISTKKSLPKLHIINKDDLTRKKN